MMRKNIYFLVIAVLFSVVCYGQRMLPGQKAAEAGFSLLSSERAFKDYGFNIGLVIHTGRGHYSLWALEYIRQTGSYRQQDIPLETYLAEGGYSLRLWGNLRKSINLNAGLSAVAGYESINRGDSLLFDGTVILDRSRFVYGAGGRLSLEGYLSNCVTLVLQARTKVLWGTTRSQLRPAVGLGIRFNF